MGVLARNGYVSDLIFLFLYQIERFSFVGD